MNFRCKPFWYPKSAATITLTSSTSFVTNPGNVYSEPIITVRGSGEITLMVGTTIVELSDISGSITLNCELKDAYTGVFTANSKVSGEFPVLQPGSNAVSWSGNVSSVEIKPNWRYLG